MLTVSRRRRTYAVALSTVGIVATQLLAIAPASAATAPATVTTFVSDLPRVAATNGLGPAEKDRSNGGASARDGRVLRAGGRAFTKGVGVHAGSSLSYRVPAGCFRFTSAVGVDDAVGNRGSVVFRVYQGAAKLYDSGKRTGASPNGSVSVAVTAGAMLRLVVTDAGNGKDRDHADWAGARLTCTTRVAVRPVVAPPAAAVRAGVPTTPAPAPAVAGPLLSETFSKADGTFVSSGAFWSTADRGLTENSTFMSESGQLDRVAGAGRTRSDYFRMWTRHRDLANVTASLDVTFNGFTRGDAGWHGINLWLNQQMCTPVPSCSAVNDPNNGGGNSGYALDFMNRDGSLTILKKVSGDTRASHPGAVSYSEGGTYYQLAGASFRPTRGQTHRLAGRSIDNGDGTTTLQVLIDGQLRLQVRDDNRVGGPRLGAGRVGLRSDFTDMTVDNFTIVR